MLLPPFFPKHVDVAMMQEENRVVRRRGISHIAADPAVHRVVHSAFANLFPTVRPGRIRCLVQSRRHLRLRRQIRGCIIPEFSQQSEISGAVVPDANLELLSCVGKWAGYDSTPLCGISISAHKVMRKGFVRPRKSPFPMGKGDVGIATRRLSLKLE